MSELAADQLGLISRTQATELLLSDDYVRAQLDGRRWQRVHRGVYATFTGPLSWEHHVIAALLFAGPHAYASHRTAAALDGFDSPSHPVQLTAPSNYHPRGPAGVVLHRTRRPDPHPVRTPRRSRTERTVIDLVNASTSLDAALGWVATACQTRCTGAARLRKEIDAWPTMKWRSEVAAMVTDIEGGSETGLERGFFQTCRIHDLPTPRRQVLVLIDGRKTYADADFHPFPVVVELDGRRGHDRPSERWRDMRRDNAMAVAGRWTLRYGYADVFGRPCQVVAQVASVLGACGWTGVARNCGRNCAL